MKDGSFNKLNCAFETSHTDKIISLKVCKPLPSRSVSTVSTESYFLSGGADTLVCKWSTQMDSKEPLWMNEMKVHDGHSGLVTAVAAFTEKTIGPEGEVVEDVRIVTVSADMTGIVWDINTGAELHKFYDNSHGHTQSINAIACFETETKSFAFTVGADATIVKWDLASFKALDRVKGLHLESIRAISLYSANGDDPISVTVGDDCKVCCYDWGQEKVLWMLTDVHMDLVVAVDVNVMVVNDSKLPVVLTGSIDKTSKLIRDGVLDSGALEGHSGAVSAVALLALDLPNQNFAVTSGMDAVILVWDVLSK